MPNPQPVLRVSGSVALVRHVQPDNYLDREKVERTPEAYGEMTIQSDLSVMDGELLEMPSFVSIRFDPRDVKNYNRGDVLDIYVRAYSGIVRIQNRITNIVVYILVGPVPSTDGRRSAPLSAGV